MTTPQLFLEDGQRLPVERLGLGVTTLGLVDQGQVVEAHGHKGMLGRQRFLEDG